MKTTKNELEIKLAKARAAIRAIRTICQCNTPKQRLAKIELMTRVALEMTE